MLVHFEQLPQGRPNPLVQALLHEQPAFALTVVASSHAAFGKSGREKNSFPLI